MCEHGRQRRQCKSCLIITMLFDRRTFLIEAGMQGTVVKVTTIKHTIEYTDGSSGEFTTSQLRKALQPQAATTAQSNVAIESKTQLTKTLSPLLPGKMQCNMSNNQHDRDSH